MQFSAPIASQFKTRLTAPGFTLIELLLVIAIIGIFAAMVMPPLTGIYNRQVLDNAANEVVSTIKMVQNRALTNNQQGYTGSEDELRNDCTTTKPYVEQFHFKVFSNLTSYQPQRSFRGLSNSNQSCPQPNTAADIGVTGVVNLPPGVHFASNDYNTLLKFDAVTGQLTIGGSSNDRAFYTLTSNHVSSLTYYICVTQGRTYVQQNTACW